MMTLSLTHVNNAILMPKLPYDPVKDFTPLSMVATGGPMLVARAESPWTTLKDLVDHARAKGSLSFGTWGNGSTAHLYGELLQRQFGLNLVHVPYKAEAMAHADLFGGLLDFAWANPASASTHARSGKMKVLGIAARRRVSVMPEVRTFAEQGLNGYDVDSWIGFYAPGKLASELQATWVNALRELTASPELQARLTAFGFEPLGNTPAQFMDVYRNDYPRAAELIKAAGVTL
jgi:tripartite-type tricarboxylate transporter receptor subunit TctC